MVKILSISARFPPHHLGGYEIRQKNIFDSISNSGHEVLVISSKKDRMMELIAPREPYQVYRNLHIRKQTDNLMYHLFIDFIDTYLIDQQIKKFQPDVIYLGHIEPLTKALMPYLANAHVPIIFDEGSNGLIRTWKFKGRWFSFVEKYTSRHALLNKIKPYIIKIISWMSGNRIKTKWSWSEDMQIIFNGNLGFTNSLDAGVPLRHYSIIHSGIDTHKFLFCPKKTIKSPVTIIIPGRINPVKGQLDAVRLVVALIESNIDAILTIVGENTVPSYLDEIISFVRTAGIMNKIKILPMITQDELVSLYHESDICFFPSYQITGFSRTPLESMACGCIVFAYGNEGSNEVIQNEKNGFLFSPEDYSGMIKVVQKLDSDPVFAQDIRNNARKLIEENHSWEVYIRKIEKVIVEHKACH